MLYLFFHIGVIMKKFKYLVLLLFIFVPLSFTACKKSNKSTLATPVISEVKSGTIIFDPVSKADYYTIVINNNEINVDANHSNNVQIIDDKINYNASKIFIVGNSYSIKIKAHASKAHSSEFSQTYSYKHFGDIETPTNVKINSTILTWDPVENASYYVVKIITPHDKLVFDKNGNVVLEDDANAIANADLPEYSFNTNHFDFSSLLSTAGNYKFYVSAIISDGTTYINSGFTSKTTYTHTITLNTPKNGSVFSVNDELHLTTAIDPRANAVTVSCGDCVQTLATNNACVTAISSNLLDINLSQCFQADIASGRLTFGDITQYSFKTKSSYQTANPDEMFFNDSEESLAILFENTQIIDAPTLTLDYSNLDECYVVKFGMEDTSLIGGFKVLVFTTTGLKEYMLDYNISSMLLTDEFLGVAVQAIGVGNYLTSPLSQIAHNPELNATLPKLNFEAEGTKITWSNLPDAYYLVEVGNLFYMASTNEFEVPISKLSSSENTFKITSFKNGFKPSNNSVNLTYSSTLTTPTSVSFSNTKLYELHFASVENSIGYYVYIKGKDATDFTKIDTLYTSNVIDLSQYITSQGEYTDYEVKVQAVADTYGVYTDSGLSSAVTVSHLKILQSPTIYSTNNILNPVTAQTVAGSTRYILKFYSVEDAGSYEILINYNKLTEFARDGVDLYEVDITNYLLSANNYEIKIRAIPQDGTTNIKASDFAVANYVLRKQLSKVENITVSENQGVYTLSFSPVDNAESYLVRIVKENDSDYYSYLNSIGLSYSFSIANSTDISRYIEQAGVYYFYMTAIASKGENSYYADSIESSANESVNKLTSLKSPSHIDFLNQSAENYLLVWNGDANADYYLVKITDPNNVSYEIKVYNNTNCNISKYLTIQGTYRISVTSMVTALGENSKTYASSSATIKDLIYAYQEEKDFLRYAVSMYGTQHDFVIGNETVIRDEHNNIVDDTVNVNSLKHLLWNHYLYETKNVNELSTLSIMLKPNNDEDLISMIKRLATQANNSKIHAFNADEQWLALISSGADSTQLFYYLCEKIIEVYPEYNKLETLSVTSNSNNIFLLQFKNKFNTTKVEYTKANAYTNTNYGNSFKFIDLYSRKSATGVFAIDSKPEMVVTTTEQLLQAVQHGFKPLFVGESSLAEQVYANAKKVLSAIVTNNMTDLEKATAIFDWLEYAFDLTYYNISGQNYLSGTVEESGLGGVEYKLLKSYYLEGIFENIVIDSNGKVVVESNLATSASYSKAFALLCSIEGISTTVVNGTYQYFDIHTQQNEKANHVWNKILLQTSQDEPKQWFNVDLTFSDNRIYFGGLTSGYGMSSHLYFLVTDAFMKENVTIIDGDETNLISSTYQSDRVCSTSFDYYNNSTFNMTGKEIAQTISNYKVNMSDSNDDYTIDDYAKLFNKDINYQQYNTSDLGKFELYLLNMLIYAKFNADNNANGLSVCEFKYVYNASSAGENFQATYLTSLINSYKSTYRLNISLVTDPTGNSTFPTCHSIKNSTETTTTVVFLVKSV